jgi:hypothetical protein
MKHKAVPGVSQGAQEFLCFAERVSVKHRCFPALKSASQKTVNLLDDFVSRRKAVLRDSKRRLHD